MQKRYKEINAIALSAGVKVDSITPGSNGHTRLIAIAPNGATRTFMLSTNPGDVRADKNAESEIRRWARENPGKDEPIGPVGQAFVNASKPAAAPAPPAATQEAVKPAAKAPRNMLSHADFYKLCEWLKTADISKVHTYTQLSLVTSNALQLTIAPSSVQNAMQTLGMALPEPPAGEAPKDRVRVVARELVGLMRELGKEPSAELMSVLGGRRI